MAWMSRENGTGEYHSSSEDGTRPGIYYITLPMLEESTLAWIEKQF
jgi:uncharacterized protein (DUF885 family)